MARTYSLPGSGSDFNDQQTINNAFTGGGDLNQTTIKTPAVAESGLIQDSPSLSLAANRSVSESLSAASTQSGTIIYQVSVSESMAGADTENALTGIFGTISETMSATSSQSELFIAHDSVSDSMTAADSASGVIPFLPNMSESMSAADTSNGLVINTAALADTLTAADHESSAFPTRTVSDSLTVADHNSNVFDTIVEANMHATDHPNRTLVYTASRTDTMHAVDTATQGINLVVTETMHAVALATEDTDGAFKLRVRETETITDTTHVTFHFSIHEAMTVKAVTAGGIDGAFNVAVHEHSGFSLTTQTSNIKVNDIVRDALVAAESIGVFIGAPNNWNLSVRELMNATDSSIDPETFTSEGLFFWGYGWAYGKYPTLAVWCAGLDCGDHPINADGSVFVPWRSDPDELFTPARLFDLSANPPEGGFGASACNIDLTTNTGGIARVVVDLAIGLPYQSTLQLLRPNSVDLSHSQYGPSLGETRRLHQYAAQLAQAQGLNAGTDEDNLQPIVFKNKRGDKYLQSQLFTGVHWDLLEDDYSFDGMLMMQIFRPYPATIAALIGFMKTMDRD